MKKWTYLVAGVLIGAVVSTSGSALAAQVKSLVGQKVTSELTVVVNGKSLNDKGAVINNKTNVPVRALADAIGADIQVSGNTVSVTTNNSAVTPITPENSGSTTNIYTGRSKESLEKTKASLENDTLAPIMKERSGLLKELETLKAAGLKDDDYAVKQTQKQLDDYNAMLTKYQAELDQVNQALSQIK